MPFQAQKSGRHREERRSEDGQRVVGPISLILTSAT